MKTRHKLLFSMLMVWAQVFAPSLTGWAGGGSALMAQEAFYIYRNDGDFNGFFFDEVKRMGVSKTDLNGEEHDIYVVQEIETKDSLYRIPLAAIDSVGFQQPELILNERFFDITAEDCPYKFMRLFDPHSWGSYEDYNWTALGTDLMLIWEGYAYWDANESRWINTGDKYLPHVGDVLYHPQFSGEQFVGKVREVRIRPETDDGRVCPEYEIICDSIENIGDIFEQFITVEHVGTDKNGEMHSRLAGMDKVRKRVSDSRELTLVALNGRFPFTVEDDNYSAGLFLNMDLSVKATLAYKIERNDWYIKLDFAEDFEFGAELSAQGKLEEELTWEVGGVPFYFPSFLPILQVKPGPGAFLKTDADVKMSITTPKFALHGRQSLSIGSGGPKGSYYFFAGDEDENNTWAVQLSLNGSMHTGIYSPFRIETNSWFKKIGYCAEGVDVYAGPKLSASFTLDPVALAESADPYTMFSGTQIQFTPKDFAIEGKAIFSAGGKKEKQYKVFEGEVAIGKTTLQLFPSFEKTKVGNVSVTDWWPCAPVTVYPRGNSLPYEVGVGVYNAEKKLCGLFFDFPDYSFWNTWTEMTDNIWFRDGTYTVCPMLNVLGTPVPVWAAAQTVKAEMPLYIRHPGHKEDIPDTNRMVLEGYLYIDGLLNKDDAIYLEYEIVGAPIKSTLSCELVSRAPVEDTTGKPEEYFETAIYKYRFSEEEYNELKSYGIPVRLNIKATVYRTKPEIRTRTVKRSVVLYKVYNDEAVISMR